MSKNPDKHFLERIRMKAVKAFTDFDLVQPGDRILVAFSGGKDSAALLDILVNRRRMPGMDYSLASLHIQLPDVGYETDAEYLQTFSEKRNVPFHNIRDHSPIVKENKQPCFYCAWTRRKLIFEYAHAHGFNKVALGHNADDFAETLLMNMLYHGELSAFSPKQSMFEGKIQIIRPLIYVSNAEAQRYVELIGFQALAYNCPFARSNHREHFRSLMIQIKKLQPRALEKIFQAATYIRPEYLPPKK